MRFVAAFILLLSVSASASARDPLGVFGEWGAFRDPKPLHCFAIAEPELRRSESGWRPFASIASWPAKNVRGQLHIRLRKNRRPDSPVVLIVGEDRFNLVAGTADAWAPDMRTDATIVRAMRSAEAMRVVARSDKGAAFSDSYPLRGAATAIDAATVACARRR